MIMHSVIRLSHDIIAHHSRLHMNPTTTENKNHSHVPVYVLNCQQKEAVAYEDITLHILL